MYCSALCIYNIAVYVLVYVVRAFPSLACWREISLYIQGLNGDDTRLVGDVSDHRLPIY